MSLDGKVAIVTGASRGIGREIAKALAAEGASVWAAARGQEQPGSGPGTLRHTVAVINKAGGNAQALRVDVRDPRSVETAFAKALAHRGGLDLLVNNAGLMVGDRSFEDTDSEIWQDILATNLTGPYLCSRAAIPAMLRNGGGTIVNITSGAAVRSGFLNHAYGASKAGLDRLTLGLADEYRERNIACLSLSPSVTDTDMLRQMYPLRAPWHFARPADWPAKAVLELLANDQPMRHSGTVVSVRDYLIERGLLPAADEGSF